MPEMGGARKVAYSVHKLRLHPLSSRHPKSSKRALAESAVRLAICIACSIKFAVCRGCSFV